MLAEAAGSEQRLGQGSIFDALPSSLCANQILPLPLVLALGAELSR